MPLVRVATVQDIEHIASMDNEMTAMHQQAWPHLFSTQPPSKQDHSHLESEIDSAESKVFVAELDGKLVGFVSIKIVGEQRSHLQPMKYAYVPSLLVAEPNRKSGIGTKLMSAAEQWSKSQGAQEIRLTVWAFNERAMRMYNEIGYEVMTHSLGKRFTPNEA